MDAQVTSEPVDVRAGGEQHFCRRRAPAHTGEAQGRDALTLLRISARIRRPCLEGGPRAQQQARNLRLVELAGHVQRPHARGEGAHLQVRPLLDQKRDRRGLAVRDRLMHGVGPTDGAQSS